MAENVLEYGTGGLNIDVSRIGSDKVTINTFDNGAKPFGDAVGEAYTSRESVGRWPANVILDDYSAQVLDQQSGKSSSTKSELTSKPGDVYGSGKGLPSHTGIYGHDDLGGASRFFYTAKANTRDRNEGLEDLEARVGENGNKWTDQDYRRGDEAPVTARKNFHPTVKPTALMAYLVKLVTPPNGTVLDPFTGSGSTGKAALIENFNFIGVEITEEYLPIIEGRLKWALDHKKTDTLF